VPIATTVGLRIARTALLTSSREDVETQSSRLVVVAGTQAVSEDGEDPRGGDATVTVDSSLDPRHNSLNFLRLVLATAVIVSHSITIGGYGSENVLGKTTLGTVAVYGFFGLSGYLIAGSASRNHIGRYLWQRVLRIFPAFWVCLVLTSFLFGVIAWFHMNPALARHCGLSCYTRQPEGPFGYIGRNLWLDMRQPTIAHTLPAGLFRGGWNASLWTLMFEFLCYLLLAALALVGLLRHRLGVAVLALSVWSVEILITCTPALNQHFDSSHSWDAMKMLQFVPIFLAGSLIYLYRDKLPDSGVLAWCSTALAALGLVLPVGNGVPAFTFTSMDLTAVFLVYPLLWLGIHLPFHKVGARNDYSYGVYIFAFPVQQLLVMWGAARWAYVPFTLLSVAAVIPFAVLSWWAVEKHALRLKTVGLPTRVPTGARPNTLPEG